VHERIEPYLESWNRFVLVEKEVARGGDTVAGFGLVGARLPCPKLLQGPAVLKIRLASMLPMIALISGSVVKGLLGGLASTRGKATTSTRALTISVLFIDIFSFADSRGRRTSLKAQACTLVLGFMGLWGRVFSDEDSEHDESEYLGRQSGACPVTR
jgi:hypothetical protein